jgi:hypothetical protein
VKKILYDLDPGGYEDDPLDDGDTWDTRVHDMIVLWETRLFRDLITWTDYHSNFEERPGRVKAQRELSPEV